MIPQAKKNIDIIWEPQAKQRLALACAGIYELFYGGAKGGGKSDFLLIDYSIGVNEYGKAHPGIIFRRSFPELEELIARSYDIYPSVFPGARFVEGKKTWMFPSGSTLKMRFLENDKDVYHYTGHQYTYVAFDELTNWPQPFPYIFMHSCARSAKGVPVRVRGSGNPGNPGHLWVKNRFVDCGEPLKVYLDPKTGLKKIYIPAKLDDNKILQQKDPEYELRLKNLPEHLYKAYREGNWDVFVGQAFGEWDATSHIIQPYPIPDGKTIYMTFDWGFGAPFSVGWWFEHDNRLVRCGEWYGWNGNPNEGIRLADCDIAQGIREKEKSLGFTNYPSVRLAGPDCFAKRPDYKGGGQLPSTADVFAEYGLFLKPGDPDRKAKVKQFHNRLRIDPDLGPGLVVFNTCKHFIRTIPALTVDTNNIEDVETAGEDHCFDSETEILTEDGWKLFDNLKQEKVATLSEDGDLQYQKPTRYINRAYSGELFSYDGRINFKVTSGHRFPIISRHRHQINKTNEWEHKRVDAINDDCYLPRTARWTTKEPERYICLKKTGNGNANNVNRIRLDYFLRYYGFFLAEGCICSPTNTHFYQYIKSLSKGNLCYEKHIPRWILNLPKKYLQCLYNGMMQGDGSVSRGMPTYSTTSKQLADDFQELLLKMGMVGNCKKYEQKHTHILGRPIKSKVPYYRIHVLKHNIAMIVRGKIKTEPYRGEICCVSVPNETIYVRRKGTPYWSSNCYDEACHILMAHKAEPGLLGRIDLKEVFV